jgi:hypothetical protein
LETVVNKLVTESPIWSPGGVVDHRALSVHGGSDRR